MTEAKDTGQEVLTPEQVTVFAAGLYYVANVDGVSESELSVIREFLSDTGHADLIDRLPSIDFEIERAVEVLDTSFLRTLFLKACVLLVGADGSVSPEEREAIEFVAAAFGVDKEVDAILSEVADESLE